MWMQWSQKHLPKMDAAGRRWDEVIYFYFIAWLSQKMTSEWGAWSMVWLTGQTDQHLSCSSPANIHVWRTLTASGLCSCDYTKPAKKCVCVWRGGGGTKGFGGLFFKKISHKGLTVLHSRLKSSLLTRVFIAGWGSCLHSEPLWQAKKIFCIPDLPLQTEKAA